MTNYSYRVFKKTITNIYKTVEPLLNEVQSCGGDPYMEILPWDGYDLFRAEWTFNDNLWGILAYNKWDRVVRTYNYVNIYLTCEPHIFAKFIRTNSSETTPICYVDNLKNVLDDFIKTSEEFFKIIDKFTTPQEITLSPIYIYKNKVSPPVLEVEWYTGEEILIATTTGGKISYDHVKDNGSDYVYHSCTEDEFYELMKKNSLITTRERIKNETKNN